jgi:hypothetical protein
MDEAQTVEAVPPIPEAARRRARVVVAAIQDSISPWPPRRSGEFGDDVDQPPDEYAGRLGAGPVVHC